MSLVRIGGPPPLPSYLMDLAVSEEFSFPGEATKFPVEQGVEFTDHIRELPDEITLDCIVSDTPIGAVVDDPSRQPVTNPDGTTSTALPSTEALQRMRELKAARQPVRIETTLGVFTSMAFIDLTTTVNKDKSPGRVTPALRAAFGITLVPEQRQPGALFFTAKFRKAVLVTNKRTKVRVRTNLAGAGGQSKIAGPRTINIGRIIQWRHGSPPGAPWHIPNIVEPVSVVYNTQTSVSPRDRIALMNEELSYEIVGAGVSNNVNEISGSGFITFFRQNNFLIASDPEEGRIVGADLIALHQDLRRDRDQLNSKTINDPRFQPGGVFAPTGAQNLGTGTRSNLPRGVDVSKWSIPSGPFAPTQAIGPGGPVGTGIVGGG